MEQSNTSHSQQKRFRKTTKGGKRRDRQTPKLFKRKPLLADQLPKRGGKANIKAKSKRGEGEGFYGAL